MKNPRFSLILLILLVTTPTSLAQKLTVEQRVAIQTYISERVADDEPGVAYGVVRNGEIILEEVAGLASLHHNVPVTNTTKFNIASVAKQFTALIVLDMAMNGKLSLEDDIRKFLPEYYPAIESPIRVRHLMNHTSGIRDYSDLMSLQKTPWWKRVGNGNDDVLELIKNQQDLNFEPGTSYRYSNSNFTILAKIAEIVSEEDFHALSRKFFDNLGMTQTEYNEDYMKVVPDIAFPYADWYGNGNWKEYPHLTDYYGDGFLYTSLNDQLIFEQLVQKAKNKSDDLLFVSQQPIPNSEYTSYGFGLELWDKFDRKAVHHSGATGANHAQTLRFPEEKISITVLSNNSTIWSGFIADHIASVILAEKDAPKMVYNGLDISSYSNNLSDDQIAGEYYSPKEFLIRIEKQEDGFYWRNANNRPIKLVRESGDLFASSSDSDKIGFNGNGFTIYSVDEPSVYKKLPEFSADLNYLNDLTGQYHSEELDVTIDISLNNQNALILTSSERNIEDEVEVVQRDELLMWDYILKARRNEVGKVSEILLTFSRLTDIRFTKEQKTEADKKKFTDDGGLIQVGTTSKNVGKGLGDILLTKNYANGNEEWFKLFGGSSYDIGYSVEVTSDGGYLVIGSTSSFGNGNYDVWLIKVDKDGNEEWNLTQGGKRNEYGLQADEKEDGNFLILASKGSLYGENLDTYTFSISKDGKVLSEL